MGYFDSIYASGLPHRAVAVYMYLKERSNRNSICWPAIPTIARELRLSESTIRRALSELCREHWLEKQPRWRENGGCTSNCYRMLK